MGLRESTSPISEGMIQVDSLFICNVILLGGVGGRCCWRISAQQVWSRIGLLYMRLQVEIHNILASSRTSFSNKFIKHKSRFRSICH
jgi:hypothetical protein